MRIGIIGPTEDEINPFIESMDGVKAETSAMLKVRTGTYAGIGVAALFCGVCKVNAALAAQMLIDRFGVSHIIVTGVAGAIDERLNICDIVVATEAAYHDVGEKVLTEYHPYMKTVYFEADGAMLGGITGANAGDETVYTGRMVTGESFITHDGREEIIEKFNPMCVDMETAAVAHVCRANSVPFAAIRSMSDTPRESGFEVFLKYVKPAAKKSVSVLKRYLEAVANGG